MEKERKFLEQMNLMDDFLMNQMVAHPVYGERFSRLILESILQKKFGKLDIVSQKVYSGDDSDKHGIRLDVYLDEKGGGIYDMEPDNNGSTEEKKVLPRRVRFYHAKIDSGIFSAGLDYTELRDVVVIFITSYDPFGLNRIIYTISNKCEEEQEMPYEDGAKTIFLYTRGRRGECPDGLKKLLEYMEFSKKERAVTRELEEIHKMVMAVKRDKKVGLAYMKSYEIEWMMKEEGRKEERKRAAREIEKLDHALQEKDHAMQQMLQEKDARIAELEKLLSEVGK